MAPALPAAAALQVHSLVGGSNNALNHYPGADALIGTADDVVSAANSTLNSSFPNSLGSYSYNAFDFVGNGSVTDPAIGPGKNAITFIGGTVTVDTAVAGAGGGPIITHWDVSGTQPFPGHGAYSAQVTSVNSGTYNPATGAFTLNVNFVANLTGGTANALNFTLTGTAWYIAAVDFGNVTGNAYVDNVLRPYAISQNAGSLFYANGSGTVPASTGGTGGSFPAMPVSAVMFGLTPIPEPATAAILCAGAAALLARRKFSGRS